MLKMTYLTIFVVGYGLGFLMQINGLNTPKSPTMEAIYALDCKNLGGSMKLGGCILPLNLNKED